MKHLYKFLSFCFLLVALTIGKNLKAHSVQVGYCVSCTGELTLYVEHWHANADPSTTTMTIQLNINGVVSTQTGSPIDNIQDTPLSLLPGCTNPINIFSSCSGEANTYNDWVVFKFPDLPCGVPVTITINSGNTVFTEDGCNMYPASSPTIIVPCIVNPPPIASQSQVVCTGDSVSLTLTGYTNAIQWQSAQNSLGPWTDIPGATTSPLSTGPLTSTTHFRALEDQGCESNPVEITVNQKPISSAGTDITTCVTNTPGNIGTTSTTGYTYSWSPPNGLSSSTVSNPTVSLTTPDTTMYVVTTTDQGCSSKDSVLVIIKPLPVSNAGTDISTCATNIPGTIGTGITPGYTYSWLPNTNINSTTTSNTTVDLTVPGTTTYTVTTTLDGCVSTDSVEVVVNPMPVANFNFEDVCLTEVTNLSDNSFVAGDSITSWSWNFGDGTPLANSSAPSHTYDAAGTYNVTLIATTSNGCMDTIVQTVEVHPNPVAQFSSNNVCDGTAVQFTESSTIPPPDIIQSWLWNFDDGATSSNQNIPGGHLYSSAGAYDVQLTVVSDFGCSDSINKTIVVNPNPNVNFSSADTAGCEPLCITFQNLSSIASGSNASWLLDYGDGSTPSSNDLAHCYNNSSVFNPESYTPVLTVTSDSGCVSTLSKTNYITVFPNPIADFDVTPQTLTIIDPIVTLTNLSTGANTWDWDFGDLMASSLEHPGNHTYSDTGSFTITLITSTQYGCVDTAQKTIIVDPDFTFFIPNVFSPNGDGINETFSGTGIFIEDFELRIFDRWGDEIFYSNNINIPWDGRANYGQQAAQQDVYVYVITVRDIRGKKHDYTGIVTLVR